MENKKGNGIFLGVIGVATLIVAIIGATFAYFSASTNSAENAISTSATSLSLDFSDDTDLLSTRLIPASETVASYAAVTQTGDKICVDDKNNSVCSVYTFTVTNPSETTAQSITVKMNVTTNTFTNLVMKIYEGDVAGSEASLTLSGSGANTTIGTDLDSLLVSKTAITKITDATSKKEYDLTELARTLTKAESGSTTNTATFTIIVWIDETGSDQTTADNGTFAAGVTVSSGSGSGVTGVISAAQLPDKG